MARLLWDEGGQIACEDHAPFPGSDTRLRGRWREITPTEAAAFVREIGRPVACETCAAIARRGAAAKRPPVAEECSECSIELGHSAGRHPWPDGRVLCDACVEVEESKP